MLSESSRHLQGLVSVILTFALLSVLAVKMKTMFLREGTVIKKNTIVDSTNGLMPAVNLTGMGMSIAFALTDFYGITLMDQRKYGKYIFYSETINTTSTEKEVINIDIPFSPCTNESYVFRDLD